MEELEDIEEQKIKEIQRLLELEKDLEVRDKFQLFAWGLKLKDALRRRRYFIEAVDELKSKFRKVLYMYLDKKAEENFKQLTDLIQNYDKDDETNFVTPKQKKLGKLSKKRNMKLKKSPLL